MKEFNLDFRAITFILYYCFCPNMIRTEDSIVDPEKVLTIILKDYKFIEPQYIRLLFEFCDFEFMLTCKILHVLKDDLNPFKIIKQLIDKPFMTDKILKGYEEAFDRKYGSDVTEKWAKSIGLIKNGQDTQTEQSEKIKKPESNFFEALPFDVYIKIMSYLDPISFTQLSQCSRIFYKLFHSESHDEYFKALSLSIFTPHQLPETCIFQEVREYILSHPNRFGPNSRNAVINDLRYYVWKMETSEFKLEKSYFQSFGSYRKMYLECPRVNLNGFYLCKDRYVRVGERDHRHAIAPLHVISYFRYFRFFENGSLLYYICGKKLKERELWSRLSAQNFETYNAGEQNSVMIGEYLQYKNIVYAKIVKSNTIFSYEFQICGSDSRVSNELKVMSYSLEVIDGMEVVQSLYKHRPNREKKAYYYCRSSGLAEENSRRVRTCGL